LRRRWWVLFLTVSIVLCALAVYLQHQPVVHVSMARMFLSVKINLAEGSLYTEELQNFFGTQIELMKSPTITSRARARVLTLRPELQPSRVDLFVGQGARTDIFLLTTMGSEPEYTQAFLDAVMEEYLQFKKEIRDKMSGSSLDSINEQLVNREKELREAQDRMHAFHRENELSIIQKESSNAADKLAKLNGELADLKTEHQLYELLSPDQQLDRSHQTFSNAMLASMGVTPVSASTLANYQKAKEQLQIEKAARDEDAQVMREAHPKMIRHEQEISRLEKAIEFYRRESLEEILRYREALALRIRNLQETIKEWQARALDSNRRMADYEKLTVEVQRTQAGYDRVLALSQNVDFKGKIDQENVSILERASVASPVRKDLIKHLAMGLAAGLVLGFGILYVLDRMDDRMTTLSELVENFNETLIGQIPELGAPKGGRLDLLQPADERHTYAEAYRNIRSSLLFMDTEGHRPKVIVLTSAVPNEGKSTVTANLALTMANAGNRVLLVDGDLRRGTQHELFKASAEPGLSEILKQETNYSQAIIATATRNLFLIPRGKTSHSAGELFLSPAMDLFLKEAERQFDFVLFDSAPVLATDDTTSFAPKVDGTLLVTRAAFTSARLARVALEQLHHRQVHLLGLIFNRVDTSEPNYTYYKYNEYYATAAR
jgi:capsular exopolysaccharide synthesis family protein